jgi:hypothetical protein
VNEPRRIKWLLDCLSNEDLSDWETAFVESVSDQFEKKKSLTDTQYDKLEEIHTKKGG